MGSSASRRVAVALAVLLLASVLLAAIASPVAASSIGPSTAAASSTAASPATASPPTASPATASALDPAATAAPAPADDAPAPADVAPASAAVTDPCGGYENATVVAVLYGDATYGPGQTVRVYGGSELAVHGCSGARIDVEERAWLEPIATTGERARVRVVDAPPAGASLGDLAGPSVPGPNVSVLGAGVETDLVDGQLAVRSADERRQLDAAVTTFREREAALGRALDALAANATALEDGAPPNDAALEAAIAAHDAYRSSVADLRLRLYDVADSRAATGRHADALRALADREATTASDAEAQISEYDRALLERERSATRAVRLRVLGGGLAGLLLGCAIGAALPLYRGIAARRALERGEWATYSRRTAALPAILGALVLLVGLGWIALDVGWQVLEVVT